MRKAALKDHERHYSYFWFKGVVRCFMTEGSFHVEAQPRNGIFFPRSYNGTTLEIQTNFYGKRAFCLSSRIFQLLFSRIDRTLRPIIFITCQLAASYFHNVQIIAGPKSVD